MDSSSWSRYIDEMKETLQSLAGKIPGDTSGFPEPLSDEVEMLKWGLERLDERLDISKKHIMKIRERDSEECEACQ